MNRAGFSGEDLVQGFTPKVEDLWLVGRDAFEDVAAGASRLIEVRWERRLHAALGCLGAARSEDRNGRAPAKNAA